MSVNTQKHTEIHNLIEQTNLYVKQQLGNYQTELQTLVQHLSNKITAVEEQHQSAIQHQQTEVEHLKQKILTLSEDNSRLRTQLMDSILQNEQLKSDHHQK